MKKKLLYLLATGIVIFQPLVVFAGPTSSTYELKGYDFGSGGTEYNDSTTYSIFGNAGGIDDSSLTSSTYGLGGGLTFQTQSNTPSAPTFTNPSSNYDRLKFVVVPSGTSPIGTDITYAIQISTTSNFSSNINYIQGDFTVGPNYDWETYSNWGGSSGNYVTGLTNGTTYYIRVASRQGKFTQSSWSVASSATTVDPSLTFGLDSSSLVFSNLNSGNSFTDSSKTTVMTTSTNAYNGYIVYSKYSNVLDTTIPNYSGTNSSPTLWPSGAGFGYTTNDNSLTGGTADRFTNGGPKYSGFTTSSPGDPVADHAGPVTTAISGEQFTISYKVTATSSTNAGTYTSQIGYVIVPTY